MAYIAWADAAAEVKGDSKLLELLKGTGDTAGAHPRFDQFLLEAAGIMNKELARGGYVTLEDGPIEDAVLRKAFLGVLFDVMTKASASREPWVDTFAAWALGHLKAIGDGVASVDGVEVIVVPTTPGNEGGTLGANFRDGFQFDLDDPYSDVHSLLPPLGSFWREEM